MSTDEESGGGNYVGNVEAADIGVIVGYFVVVMGFGIWSSLKNRGTVGGYFLAGRSMNFILIGASLFASNIGSGHFIGLAGSGAASGIGIAVFELNAIFVLMILGWVFVPVYIASGVFTMPEYLRLRFGGQRIRVYLAVLALLLSVFTKVAADLFAGAIFINQALGWDIYLSIIVLLIIAALFTIVGGLTAVIWTDFIQTIIMIIGAFWLMIASFIEIGGGYSTVTSKFMTSVSNHTFWCETPELYPGLNCSASSSKSCGYPPASSLHLIRPADDPDLPWPGVFFGLTISSVWYWCSDQVIVQRALSAKNLSHAKAGTVLAGWLKILPLWILVLPGMISRILYPDDVACTDPDLCQEICGSSTGCTNIAYPLLVIRLMPVGARGLMLAVMMSALMSSLTSIFNSSSTIFTMDIWTRFRTDAKDMELMVVGRCFVLVMVGVGVAWIPIVQNFSELFHYIQSVTSYLAPPICAVYVLAVLWSRTNEMGAFYSLMVGLVVGLIRFIWESVYGQVPCGEETSAPDIITKVHYLHFGIMLFGIVLIVCMVVSEGYNRMNPGFIWRLTFWTRHNKEERKEREGPSEVTVDHTHAKENKGFEDDDDDLPVWRTALNWCCGIEKQPELTDDQKKELAQQTIDSMSLYEDPRWYWMCNVAAVILMTVGVFLWAFFN
ncbi:hypothetical protein CAPTEDRAFT_167766 [Capitella teleta]|uniref:Sodium/glucose cotransporter 4 n=1 Tax=Capitella teleta TaxID=283909 RepID=R7TLZ6_CAPTE|nr:hypothetical protein CAPTEDRAFT_167766 [Capitella teleta]|eukprot:ELT94684.1 hypothetical protein CAPTEDRAFT_167766 [Capitella teleta]